MAKVGVGATTERVRRLYAENAHRFDRQARLFERLMLGDGRYWVCSQARGDVLEIGVGTALNLPHYPEGVRLTGIDLSLEMVEIAGVRSRALGRHIDLRVGDAEALPFPDDSFDTLVCTISLCTIPDDRQAIREVRRVLRSAGLLVLLEHVRSPSRLVRAGQRLLEPLTLRFHADHLLREPLDHLRAEGFEVERLERSRWGIIERVAARKCG